MRTIFSSRQVAVASCAVAAVALVGCTSVNSGRTFVRSSGPVAPAAPIFSVQQVNGSWRDSAGNFTAEFRDGQFQSIAPDTGQSVAVGSYRTVGNDNVAINFKTAAGTESSASCRYQTTVMSCQNPDGRSFTMLRT